MSEQRDWPQTPEEVRDWAGSNFNSLHYGSEGMEPHANDIYEMSAHDILSAFDEWVEYRAEVKGSSAPSAEPDFDAWVQSDPLARAHADNSRDLCLIEHGWRGRATATQGAPQEPLPAETAQPMFASHVGRRKWESLQGDGYRMQRIQFARNINGEEMRGSIDPWGKVAWESQGAPRVDLRNAVLPSLPEHAAAWVIPGDDGGSLKEWVDARTDRYDEFTAPLFTASQMHAYARHAAAELVAAQGAPTPAHGMRAEFDAWVRDRGCDTDGAWSAWQACWNLLAAGIQPTPAQAEPSVAISGELCELGDLDPEHIPRPGFRIQRPGGRVVTVTGLTREEVRALPFLQFVALSIAAGTAGDAGTTGESAAPSFRRVGSADFHMSAEFDIAIGTELFMRTPVSAASSAMGDDGRPTEASPVPRELEEAVNTALDLHPISIRLPKALIERYKQIAAGQGLIYQPLMRKALAEWIAASPSPSNEREDKR